MKLFGLFILNMVASTVALVAGIIVGLLSDSWKVGLLIGALIIALVLVADVVTAIRGGLALRRVWRENKLSAKDAGSAWGDLLSGGKKPANARDADTGDADAETNARLAQGFPEDAARQSSSDEDN